MFGHYSRDFAFTDSDIHIHLEQENGLPKYVRDCCGNRAEKLLPAAFEGFHIHPVEPVNLPTAITRYLEISFPLLVLPPSLETTIYLKFPVEAGCFPRSKRKIEFIGYFFACPVKIFIIRVTQFRDYHPLVCE